MTRNSLILLTITLLSGGGPFAHAQKVDAIAAPERQAAQPVRLAVAAQPIAAALNDFARQSGLHVVIGSEVAKGVRSAAIEGMFTPEAALERLLKDTGLRYEYLDAQTVAVMGREPRAKLDEVSLRLADDNNQGSKSSDTSSQSGDNTSSEASKEASEDKSKIQEIVVTAQKREERLKDVPISISVLSGGELDSSPVRDITYALRDVPGVVIYSDLNDHTVVIRGGARLAGSSPTAYYFDGLAFEGVVPGLNAFDLDRVEVLRGPQGTLYGANSQTGLVRVFSQDASLDDFELKGRASGSTTDDGGNSYRADVALNAPVVAGKVGLRGVVGYQKEGGWISGPYGENLNAQELKNFRLKVNAQPTEAFSVELGANWVRNDADFPDMSDDDRGITATIPEPQSADFDIYTLGVNYDFSRFSLSNVAGYYRHEKPVIVDLGIYEGLSAFHGFQGVFDPALDNFTDELVAISDENSAWRWTLGAYYQEYQFDNYVAIPGFGLVLDDSTKNSKSYAVFGEIGRRFLDDKWQWAVGLRYFEDKVDIEDNLPGSTYHPEATFDATTPRAVLSWFPSANTSLYASYSEGFRSGVLQGATSQEFPPANPDTLYNYELGVKRDFLERRLAFDIAVYYMDWQDVIQAVVLPLQDGIGRNVFVNGESASGLGVDFATVIRPLNGLELGLNFSWNDLTMDEDVYSFDGTQLQRVYAEGDRLSFSSEWTAAASADYTFPLASQYSARISASANYNSEQDLHLLITQGALTTVGDDRLFVRGGLSLLAQKWTATLFIDNATNEYGTIPAQGSEEYLMRLRPRSVGLQFDFRY